MILTENPYSLSDRDHVDEIVGMIDEQSFGGVGESEGNPSSFNSFREGNSSRDGKQDKYLKIFETTEEFNLGLHPVIFRELLHGHGRHQIPIKVHSLIVYAFPVDELMGHNLLS